MKKVLDIELFVYESMVFGKIKDQDLSVLKRGDFTFNANNGLGIASSGCPQLISTTLFVKGTSTSYDNKVIHYVKSDNDEAKQFAEKIKAAVEELNEKYAKKAVESSLEKVL